MKEPSDGVLAGLRSASSVAADAAGAPEVSVRSDSRSAGMGVAWTKETPRVTAGSEHGVPAAIREVRKQKSRRGRETEPASPVGGGGAHVRGPAGRRRARFILRVLPLSKAAGGHRRPRATDPPRRRHVTGAAGSRCPESGLREQRAGGHVGRLVRGLRRDHQMKIKGELKFLKIKKA